MKMRKVVWGLVVMLVAGSGGRTWADTDFSPFASAFAVGGQTVGGVTTFGPVVQYQGGLNSYHLGNPNRWGDYSATTLDPSDPTKFWTIQEWASGKNQWSTQIAEVSVGAGNTLNILRNFTGSNFFQSGFIPPDTMGAVGPNHFAELLNGAYAVYNKSDGTLAQPRQTLDQFWTNAGATPTGGSFDPRILYDPFSKHWFATSADGLANFGSPNDLLIAVSKTSNPLDGWTGFAIPANPTTHLFADFPTLGINGDGVFVADNNILPGGNFSLNTTIVALDKAQLIAGNLSGTQFENVSAFVTGVAPQPVVDMAGGHLPETLLGEFNTPAGFLKRSDITGSFNNPPLSGVSGPFIAVNPYGEPAGAPQPIDPTLIDTGDTRIGANALLVNGELWETQTVQDPLFNHAAIRWSRIDPTTSTVIQEGLIDDPTFAYYYPSVSVDPNGDVVIGFSGSSAVPEPSSFVLLAIGAFGLLGYARRRK
jgi:hypothetical protein